MLYTVCDVGAVVYVRCADGGEKCCMICVIFFRGGVYWLILLRRWRGRGRLWSKMGGGNTYTEGYWVVVKIYGRAEGGCCVVTVIHTPMTN